MDYLNYLQQYREKYHLDDIFNHNNNADVEQVKKYIGELCGVSYDFLDLFCDDDSEKHFKGGRTFPSNIHRFVMKNSVLENTRKEPKNIDYLTRFLVTTLDQPDCLILDSIAKENNPLINKNISSHENTSSDTLLYLASYSFLGINIFYNKNSNDDVLLEVTNTFLQDLSNKIYEDIIPENEDWGIDKDLDSYIKEYKPGFFFFRWRTLDKIEWIARHFKISENICNKMMSVDLETLKTLEWYNIFYHLGRNPFTPETILEILSERKNVGPYKPDGLIGVLENPNAPKHILEKYSTHNKMIYRERVAQNPNTPPETLARLANDEDFYVRREVAWNPNTPPETLDRLANDNNRFVRRNVATNFNTTPETLDLLANDKSWGTLSYVAHSRNASVKTLQNIINNLETFERKGDSSDWLIGHLKDFCTERSLFLTSNS